MHLWAKSGGFVRTVMNVLFSWLVLLVLFSRAWLQACGGENGWCFEHKFLRPWHKHVSTHWGVLKNEWYRYRGNFVFFLSLVIFLLHLVPHCVLSLSRWLHCHIDTAKTVTGQHWLFSLLYMWVLCRWCLLIVGLQICLLWFIAKQFPVQTSCLHSD